MNTFRLKIAGLAVVIVGLIILVNKFTNSKSEPKPEPKTVYDVWEQDDKRLRAEPEVNKPAETKPGAESLEAKPGTEVPAAPAETKTPVEQPKMQFKELSPEDEVRASQLFEWALAERKMGRLPGVKLGYKNMVDHCREIIGKYPDSVYAFKARRMLGEVPKRYWKQYHITEEEINPKK